MGKEYNKYIIPPIEYIKMLIRDCAFLNGCENEDDVFTKNSGQKGIAKMYVRKHGFDGAVDAFKKAINNREYWEKEISNWYQTWEFNKMMLETYGKVCDASKYIEMHYPDIPSWIKTH
jgi:hypothetical protein